MKKNELKWLKAAIIGTMWAASEIIIGSFLHNLKIPFRSQILTSIGVLLVTIPIYSWKVHGLAWRAGIICALMKAISPSSVILGPMIAITAQGFLIDLSFRFLGFNFFSFVFAGILTMTWNIFQYIINLVVLFGQNLVEVFRNSIFFLQKQTGFKNITEQNFLLVIFVFFVFWGLMVGILSYFLAKLPPKISIPIINNNKYTQPFKKQEYQDFNYSVGWLVFNFFSFFFFFYLVKFKWYLWLTYALIVLIVWIFRYKHLIKRLFKGFFIISLFVIVALTLFFVYLENKQNFIEKGVLASTELFLRAFIVVGAFTTLGKELKNPKFETLTNKNYLKNFKNSLQLAFEFLPDVLSSMPSVKFMLVKPIVSVQIIHSHLNYWVVKHENQILKRSGCIIITGDVNSGKTSLASKLVDFLKDKYKIGGFLARSHFENGQKKSYFVENITNGNNLLLASLDNFGDTFVFGRFYFSQKTFKEISGYYDENILKNIQIFVLDEVGPLEIRGDGWFELINRLIKKWDGVVIFVVRKNLLEKFMDFWALEQPLVVDVNNFEIEKVSYFLQNYFSPKAKN